jgi:hypothetical protein
MVWERARLLAEEMPGRELGSGACDVIALRAESR